ncbi:35914_t:CDS:2 [Racocetra persica]|uniref:35914_t:CDS:1 n=1 Tax=Racocetra persica TaxID=160502 RepID=A0ACA9SKR2_9GLOM|nr:35914_t:CDS:2 [Racocetra persica]
MTPETINLRSKTFLIEMLKLMKLEGDRQGEPITNTNEILTIQGKKKLDPGHFEFENDEQHFKFLRMNNEDQKDIIQNLKNSLQGGANYKQQNEQILTNLKNILGDNLTD